MNKKKINVSELIMKDEYNTMEFMDLDLGVPLVSLMSENLTLLKGVCVFYSSKQSSQELESLESLKLKYRELRISLEKINLVQRHILGYGSDTISRVSMEKKKE